MDDGVSVALLGAGQPESAVVAASAVGVVGFECAGGSVGESCATDLFIEFGFGVVDAFDPVVGPLW